MQSTDIENRQLRNIGKAMHVIGSEERAGLIWLIGTDKKRFSDLLRLLPDTGVQELSATLKRLEFDGVVLKSVEEGAPRKTFFLLTEKGKALLPVLGNLIEWVELEPDDGAGDTTAPGADEKKPEESAGYSSIEPQEQGGQPVVEETKEVDAGTEDDADTGNFEVIEGDEDEEIVIEGRSHQADTPQFSAGAKRDTQTPEEGESQDDGEEENSLHSWINRRGHPEEIDDEDELEALDEPDEEEEPEKSKEGFLGKMKSNSMFSSLNKWSEKYRGSIDEEPPEEDNDTEER